MSEEYTPDIDDVRGAWHAWNDGQVDEHRRKPTWSFEEFDRWLRKVQAEAWEKGYLDMDADRIYGTGTENPYRENLQST